MFTAGAIVGDIDLDNSKSVRAIREVGKEALGLKQTVGQAMEETGSQGGKGFIKGLNTELGKKSMLGQITKLAVGGGAIAGASMLGRELNAATGEMADLTDALRSGEMTQGQFAEKMMGSIPVLGQFWQAGRNIREMLTGEEAAAKAAAKSFDEMRTIQEASFKRQQAIVDDTRKSTEQWIETIGRLKDALAILKATPEQRDQKTLEVEHERELKTLREKYEKDANLKNDKGMPGSLITNASMLDAAKVAADKLLAERNAAVEKYNTMAIDRRGGDLNSHYTQNQTAAAYDAFTKADGAYQKQLAFVKSLAEDQHRLSNAAVAAKQKYDEAMAAENELYNTRMAQASKETTAEFVKKYGPRPMGPQWDGMKPEATKFDAANSAFEKALDKLRPAITHQFERLPNPTVQAEELFGSKTVTGSNPGYVDVEKENSAITKENTAALKEATAAFRQGPMPGVSQNQPLAIQEIH